jgi:hypothetical protein
MANGIALDANTTLPVSPVDASAHTLVDFSTEPESMPAPPSDTIAATIVTPSKWGITSLFKKTSKAAKFDPDSREAVVVEESTSPLHPPTAPFARPPLPLPRPPPPLTAAPLRRFSPFKILMNKALGSEPPRQPTPWVVAMRYEAGMSIGVGMTDVRGGGAMVKDLQINGQLVDWNRTCDAASRVDLGDRLISVGNTAGGMVRVDTRPYQEVIGEIRASILGWQAKGMLYMEFTRESREEAAGESGHKGESERGRAAVAVGEGGEERKGEEGEELDGSDEDEDEAHDTMTVEGPVDLANLGALLAALREPSELAHLLRFVGRAHKQQLLFVCEVEQLTGMNNGMNHGIEAAAGTENGVVAAAVLGTAGKILRVFLDLGGGGANTGVAFAADIDDEAPYPNTRMT